MGFFLGKQEGTGKLLFCFLFFLSPELQAGVEERDIEEVYSLARNTLVLPKFRLLWVPLPLEDPREEELGFRKGCSTLHQNAISVNPNHANNNS